MFTSINGSTSTWVIVAMVLAMAVTFAVTPLVKIFAFKINAIDVPKDNRRMHTMPIPRIGGLAIFFGFFISIIVSGNMTMPLRGILIGGTIIAVLGVIDDLFALHAGIKIVVQLAAATTTVMSGVRIDMLSNFNFFSDNRYFSLGFLSIPVSILWILAITNAVNLIDGLDGLAAGVSAIASLTFMMIAFLTSMTDMAIIAAALAGACIGFLPYNMNPAKIFMGDTGATFLGFTLATISIQGMFKMYAVVSFAVPLLALGFPIFETVFSVVRRLRAGRKPWEGDRNHLHHKLIDVGFSQKQAVAIMCSVSAILGLTAVVLTGYTAVRALSLLVIALLVVFMGVRMIFISDKGKYDEESPHEKEDQISLYDIIESEDGQKDGEEKNDDIEG